MKYDFGLWAMNIALAVLAALVLVLFFGVPGGWFGLLFTAVIAVCCGFGIRYLMDRHDALLAARVAAERADLWEVQVNGVRVGTISDSVYAGMKRSAFHDGALALSQLLNVGHVAVWVLSKMVIVIPMVVFWAAILVACFAPEAFGELRRELQTASPEVISVLALTWLKLLAVSSLAAFILLVAMGYRIGFRNYYDEAINLMLRQKLNVAAKGDVLLARTGKDGLVAWVKRHKGEHDAIA